MQTNAYLIGRQIADREYQVRNIDYPFCEMWNAIENGFPFLKFWLGKSNSIPHQRMSLRATIIEYNCLIMPLHTHCLACGI